MFWRGAPTNTIAVEVTLTVPEYPQSRALYFFALQASFAGDGGRRYGAGHLGLQWYPPHPGATAVNWGGYDEHGHELRGGASALASATNNANTRDYPWRPARPYRLRIERVADGWQGSVFDLTHGTATVVRTLLAEGTHLVDPMVWSEVFAPCDAPSVTAEWSNCTAVTPDGPVTVTDGQINYQSFAHGGCTNTATVRRADGTWVQRTNAPRP